MKYLPFCIQSMLNQDSKNWQCVFVDGYSTDGSWEYMQQFSSDPRFLLLRGRKQGMYIDWNECLKYVDTEYFYFLTSDDTCFPELVSTTTSALDAHKDIDVCHFQFSKIDSQGKTLRTYAQIIHKQFPLYVSSMQYAHRRSGTVEFIMHCIFRSLYITITSLVFRRRIINKLGGFTNQYGSSGDYDWTMRMGLHTDVLYIPKHLATWRRTFQDQATQNPRSSEVVARGLAIAKKNLLDTEMHTKLTTNSIRHFEVEKVISHLSYEYVLSLYSTEVQSKHLLNSLKYLYLLVKTYPKISFKNFIQALLRPKSDFLFHSRTNFASNFIDEYDLNWPPRKVHVCDSISF